MTVGGMTFLRERVRSVRASGDQGSVLALALAFLMVFGLYVGIVLQFSSTGLRTTVAVRDAATGSSAGGGALDGAINTMRSAPTSGVAPAAPSTCFTLPAGQLGNPSAVTVSCEPRSTSGTALTASQPASAITALSTVPTEGVTLTGANRKKVKGGVRVNQRLAVPTGAILDSTGYPVEARPCQLTGTGQVLDSCVTGAGVTDPNYPGPSLSTVRPATPPACGPAGPKTLTLQPGIYRSPTALQALLNCSEATIIFSSGTYFFDFTSGTRVLTFAGGAPRNSVIIGGRRLGSSSSCDPSSAGVDLVFGGDSRLTVNSGRVDLCALEPTSTTAQHIVLRGMKPSTAANGNTSVTETGATVGTGASSTGTPWINPTNGLVPNTPPVTTTANITGAGVGNAVLRVDLPAAVVPTDALNISATITVKESVVANPAGLAATTTAALFARTGASLGTVLPLTTCTLPATPCDGTMRDDTTAPPIASLTPAQLNGTSGSRANIRVTLNKPAGAGTSAQGAIDGVTLNLSYQLPIRPVCRLASATGNCLGALPTFTPSTTAMFSTAAVAYTTAPVALHGTVYAPTASVDLRLILVNATVVDRGIIVRHLALGMSPAAGSPPPMISVPDLQRGPRRVIMIATDGSGTRLARADVTFADTTGTQNGDIPKVLEWSVG